VVAFKIDDGSVAWKASDHEASYSSPTLATIDGKRRALFFSRKGLLVLDPVSGAVELEFPWRARIHASVNAATPLVSGNKVFISTSYGVGAVVLELRDGKAATVWELKDALTNHYATSVLDDGHLYGYHGRLESRPDLRCVEFETGQVRWTEKHFGGGSVLVAGAHLLLMSDSGKLTLARASPEKFEPLASAKILEPTVRAYPALAGGKLYARNSDTLVCVDLGKGTE
jgi:outer membrane protein assembly factor BamB